MKLINYIESVEVNTDSTAKTRFYFSDQPTLRNKRIQHIHVWEVAQVSKAPSGLAVVNDTVFAKSFLVLVSKNREVINRYPLAHLRYFLQNANALLFDLVVDWSTSYIEIGSIASLSATETFLFTFYCNDHVKEIPLGLGINIENIEVRTTPATIHKFVFPDNENLKGKNIHGIEYISSAVSMTPYGESLINATAEVKAFLNIINTQGNHVIVNLPVYAFMSVPGPTAPEPSTNFGALWLDGINIDFPKSYWFIPDTGDTVADEILYINIYFYDVIR